MNWRMKDVLKRAEETPSTVARANKFYASKDYFDLKTRIHDRLLNLVDLSILDSLDEPLLRQEIRKLVDKILSENHYNIPLNLNEREKLFLEIQDEVLGLGPLEPFSQDHIKCIHD